MLFLRPLGGSIVAFTPFYKILTGNLSLGIEVSQILKLLFLSSTTSSIIPSRVGIKDGHK